MNEPPKNTSAKNIDNQEQPKVQVADSPAEREPKETHKPKAKAKKAKADKPKPKASTCASELKKYDWNHTVAHNVMLVESGNNHQVCQCSSHSCF